MGFKGSRGGVGEWDMQGTMHTAFKYQKQCFVQCGLSLFYNMPKRLGVFVLIEKEVVRKTRQLCSMLNMAHHMPKHGT